MWIMRWADSYQSAKIKKLLSEGFEPYAAQRITTFTEPSPRAEKTEAGHGDKQSITRYYFRKQTESLQIKMDFSSEVNRIVEAFDKLPVRLANELTKALEINNQRLNEEIVSLVTATPKFNLDELDHASKGETIEKEVEPPEANEIIENRREPQLPNRIADPEPPQPTLLTPQQESAIESIRGKYNSNSVTVLPADEDGKVKILVDDLIYDINIAGNIYLEEARG